ncbi:ABC transporter substrate-binding protein [Sodalis sp. dw_96]|uniref:ABC transporter substrate-binding protein n=1 Tax=Sodalis sp. dw_96 TaxID=2719794 RepID=UPI001BD3219D|nr:ABC transporter substrate-binding protein [Sodalis sp. dw_96]
MQRRRFVKTLALWLLTLPVIPRRAWSGTQAVAEVPPTAPVPRLAVLDWGLVETVLALGITPVGVAEIDGYRDNVVIPAIPAGVAEVGLRLAPSLEWLQQLAPDIILINSSQESQRAMLERICPVRAFAVYTDEGAPLAHALAITDELGRLCRREAAAGALIAETHRTLAHARGELDAYRRRIPAVSAPLYLIRFFDALHIGIYGRRSLFQDVMDALGVRNAWDGPTDYWGIGVAGLEALAARHDSAILYFTPLPAPVALSLQSNRLWQALPAVKRHQVFGLAPFWGFGMLPSAGRFARELLSALGEQGGETGARPEGGAEK